MARHSRRRGEERIVKQVYDHAAMFVDETRKVAVSSAVLDAYRKSMGLVFGPNTSHEARTTLAAAAQASARSCHPHFRHDWARAMENAGKNAMLAYVGGWWSARLCHGAPATLNPGEEFYSRETLRRVIELHKSPVPDVRGSEPPGGR